MDRTSRRVRHAGGDLSVTRRSDIGPPDSHMGSPQKGVSKVSQPIRVGIRVVIHIGDDFAGRRYHPSITSGAQALVRSTNGSETVERGYRFYGSAGAVIHHNYLEIRIPNLRQGVEAGAYGAMPIVGTDHNRDARPEPGGGKGRLAANSLHRLERRFVRPVPAGETEIPVFDIVSAAMPFVSPGK